MEKKAYTYICTGCDIGESLDIEALSKVAMEEYGISVKTHTSFCGKEGTAIIKKDMDDEGVNTIILAACSPRAKLDVFSYDPLTILLERVNLREHVVWCQPPNNEDTQMMAEDYLRMGISRAQKMEVPEPFNEDMCKAILVVGGGLTGMTAAVEASNAGYEVVLVEKAPELGGFAAKNYKTYSHNPPYESLEGTGIEDRIKAVEGDGNIRVFTAAKIAKIEGAPGMFDVHINQNGKSETVRIGSIVLASGWQPYDATKLGHLGYGKSQNVITNVTMEEMASNDNIVRPSDGKPPKSVVFIQCAGSRDENHLPYCSTVCCLVSLKQARYVREKYPDTLVYIIYKDMRTPAQYENFYKKVQNDDGVFLTKGEVVGVGENGGDLVVEADDTLLGEKIKLKADLVVLATGMVSTTAIEVEGAGDAEPEGGAKKEEEEARDTIIQSDILNLDYRQGPELPQLDYGFPDSHYICFPYETRRTGIYAAGPVRYPMDGASSISDARGAALKAIQCVELTSKGMAVHPRAGDMTYPDLFTQRCTQCKRCTVECPFGMYNEDEKSSPLPNPTRCRRCAICMGSCPERIISFKNHSIDIIGSMAKAIEVPDPEDEKPRVVVFVCENDAYPALDMAGINRLTYSPYVRIIPLRCIGNMNLVWVADSLSKGIDGILLLGCKHGDDYQCHFIKGSELADYRLGKVQETLDRLMLEAERIKLVQISINEYDQIPRIINEFMDVIEEMEPNPFKEF